MVKNSKGSIGIIVVVLLILVFSFLTYIFVVNNKQPADDKEISKPQVDKVQKVERQEKMESEPITFVYDEEDNCQVPEDIIGYNIEANEPLGIKVKLPSNFTYTLDSDEDNKDWALKVPIPNSTGVGIYMCVGCQFTSEIQECGLTNEKCDTETVEIGNLDFTKSTFKDTGIISSLISSHKGVEILINVGGDQKEVNPIDLGVLESIISCTSFPTRN